MLYTPAQEKIGTDKIVFKLTIIRYAGVAFSALGQAIADKNGELIEFLEGRLALMLDGTAATLTEKPFGF